MRFGPPDAETVSASPAGRTEATLRASVDPNGLATDYFFEYGATTAYGSSTATVTLSAEAAEAAASSTLIDLLPDHSYHFRVVATNEAGSVTGADRSFT